MSEGCQGVWTLSGYQEGSQGCLEVAKVSGVGQGVRKLPGCQEVVWLSRGSKDVRR